MLAKSLIVRVIMFAGDGDDKYAFPELGSTSPTSMGLGATTPVTEAMLDKPESKEEAARVGTSSEAEGEVSPPPLSANTRFRMRKLDHESLIRKEIEERKAMVAAMNSVKDTPHPLETPLRKEIKQRPMSVNTEIFEGLGIGENEIDPQELRETKLKSQAAFLSELDRDAMTSAAIREEMKDERYYLKNRKPIERKATGEPDIDPKTILGANEARLAAEKRATANEWLKKSLADADGLRERRKAERKAELAPVEGAEFVIGSASDGSREARIKSQQLYNAQLTQDIASMQRAPSAKGIDINFTFGGASRDDRPTTQDRRSKVNEQETYRRLLDDQIRDMEERKAEAKAMMNAPERAPPPYMEM